MASKRQLETDDAASKRFRGVDSQDSRSPFQHLTRGANEAEVGIIESVILKNFMCHSHLEFKFGSNVNFVTGKNGSGKSAILTAVVVGLGGAANATNRGTTVKNFIMNGKHSAEVMIRLRNCGEDAYKPDLYGNCIYVERKFFANGTSAYRLINQHHKVVAKKKEDLTAMLDHFNIQVDNPLCILNQDASRKFLQSENPKSLYKLLVRATQLQSMLDDFADITCKNNNTTLTLQKQIQGIKYLEKELHDWKAKIEQQESLKGLHSKIDQLNKDLTWAQIKGLEDEVQEDSKQLENLKSTFQKISSKAQEWEQKLTTANLENEKAHEQMKKLKEEITCINSECEKTKMNATEKKQAVRTAQTECQTLNNNIMSLSRDKRSLLQRLDELRKGEKSDYQAEKQRRQQQIEELEKEKARLEATFETSELDCRHLQEAMNEARRHMDNISQEIRDVSQKIQGNDRKLQAFESSRFNYQKRFGPWVPDALSQIDAAFQKGAFVRKPHGPLGCFIKLVDNKWSLAIENCIRPLLFAFCCDNHQDERTLERILSGIIKQSRGKMPTIITSRFADRLYDTRSRCIQSQYPRVLDMLQIDEPVVANCLIDQRRIECILLIENATEARRVMQSNVPRYCEEAFTLHGDQIYPSPKFRVYSSQKDTSELLQTNMENNIRALQAENDALLSKQRDLRASLPRLQDDISRNAAQKKITDSNLCRFDLELRKIKSNIGELKNVEEPEPIYLTTLEESLKDFNTQLDAKEAELHQMEETYEKYKEEYIQANENYKALEKKLSSFNNDQLMPLKHFCATIAGQRHEAQNGYQHYEQKLRALEEEIENKRTDYVQKLGEVENFVKGIEEKLGPRPAKLGDAEKIQNKLSQMKKVLESQERECGSREEVIEKYQVLANKYDSVSEEISNLRDCVEKLETSLCRVKRHYRYLRSYISMRVQQYFVTLLGLRSFKGTLRLDHKEEKLYISIHSTKESEKNSNVRTLSGGERSFSTVAFVLSLWETIDSPFRMMDEFDVFMDMVNRRFSMTMMLDTATAKKGNQFIFLTPLDMSHVKSNPSVRIYEMKAPDRNQAALPFHPVAETSQEEEEETE